MTGTVAGEKAADRGPGGHDPGREVAMGVRVGQKAPDFTAPAYYKGGFTTVQLSSYAGKWLLLCFYPGDFTFV
ncbi:MAG TPA: redoxin domain-containing protein, partial [Frankiaceae bacterium]|nr:redoxin domain-containing protein [Frankiaceae bacterium]